MKKIFMILSLLAAASFAAVSCLDREFSEENPVFAVSSYKVVLPSDVEEGQNLVADTLWITSNRTWTVSIPDTLEWIKLDRDGHQGISGVSERVPLVINCEDNATAQSREAELTICGSAGSKKVKVTQSAIRHRLALVKGERQYSGLNPEGEKLTLGINTNSAWSIALKAGSTIVAKFSQKSGDTSAEIDVTVAENDDRFAGKEGTVVISAEGCRSIEIPVSQLKGYPIFRIEMESLDVQAEDGLPNFEIPIHTNLDWKAEIVSVKGYDSLEVKGAEGGKGAKAAKIEFPYCIAFGEEGEIVVKLTAEEIEGEKIVTIKQKPCIRFRFLSAGLDPETTLYGGNVKIMPDASAWPFKEPVWSYIPSSKGSAKNINEKFKFVLLNDFELFVYSSLGLWKNSVTGWMFGGAKDNYLLLPAVPGFKLVKIVYCFRGTSAFKGTVRAERDGTMVNLSQTFSTGGQGSITEIPVSGAQPGEACGIYAAGGTNYQIGEMTLYYE